ncbi:putative ester cyclase [Terriglobus roseus DSM 18391]|uniref:Putative ester cyclase n=1 Tax=Terriglobus roseus (strain DSM 18391 / NRRL B-41598 / KBS 63) TaxID=926566 RepID=I3ZEH3_TERRK|nr:ester cyclase [Terriglobus roseus]AFL87641.1 putative ester cyclase [Terriglobus roseus DSM 18391]
MQDVRELTHRWFEEVWNQGRLDTVDELLASNAQAHGFPDANSVQDAAGFRATVVQLHEAFPKIHLKVEDVFVEGNKSAVRWTAAMHASKDASDAPAELSGFATAEWSNGQIVKAWNFVDMAPAVRKMQEISAL